MSQDPALPLQGNNAWASLCYRAISPTGKVDEMQRLLFTGSYLSKCFRLKNIICSPEFRRLCQLSWNPEIEYDLIALEEFFFSRQPKIPTSRKSITTYSCLPFMSGGGRSAVSSLLYLTATGFCFALVNLVNQVNLYQPPKEPLTKIHFSPSTISLPFY